MLKFFSPPRQTYFKSSDLIVTSYNDIFELEHLKLQWNDLLYESAFPNIFMTWEWLSTWWKFFGSKHICYLITITDKSDSLIAIAPLYFKKLAFLSFLNRYSLRFIGDGGPICSDYLGIIIRNKDIERVFPILRRFLSQTIEHCAFIQFSDLLTGSATEQLIKCLNFFSSSHAYGTEISPYITLPSSYDEFLNNLSKNRKKRLLYELRRAKKDYNIHFECFKSSYSVDNAFSTLLQIFKKSKKGDDKNMSFNKMSYTHFHIHIAKTFASENWLRIYILWFNDTPVSFVYGFLYNRTFWFYQTGFDVSYKNYSAGSLAVQLAIDSIISENAVEFDFLRGDESYKFHYATGQRTMKTFILFRNRGPTYAYLNLRHYLSLFKNKIIVH